jgi:DNA-binding helix-hairpin-helix protein with protein kinase domain
MTFPQTGKTRSIEVVPEMLRAPQRRFRAEMLGIDLRIVRKLGEGTQGEVYLAEGDHGKYAIKWYKPEQATEEQRRAIRYLVGTGPPKGAAGRRFIWPLDLVTAEGVREFGYLMAFIDMDRYADLGEVWAHLKPVPNFSALCEISYQLANSYRALHLTGHCYRDISAGNLVFNPKTGDILICDNDNVGINRQSRCQVWGTMEYMAPEIIRGERDPSTGTDLHSLAVLLFYLWCWHHPFHGEMEYAFRCWDIPAKKKVYGEDPVFVFDPEDTRNRLPDDPDYAIARERWSCLPAAAKALFLRSFSEGLKNPDRRVTEGEWQRLFLQIKDGIFPCTQCRAENFSDESCASPHCWHCGRPLRIPPRLTLWQTAGRYPLVLNLGTKIRLRHIHPLAPDEDLPLVIGEVVPHPGIPGSAGIRNYSSSEWTATFPDGGTVAIPHGRAVPLHPGTVLSIDGVRAEIGSGQEGAQ